MVDIEIANILLCEKMSSMLTLNTYVDIILKMCSFTLIPLQTLLSFSKNLY